MLGEQVVVQERQLDGVGDLLDLGVETTDVGVGDVGHLLEQQVLDLGPRQLLEQHVGARVESHGVAAAQVHAAQRVGQLADALLVGAADHHGAHAVVDQLLDGHDLAGDLRSAGLHDVEALVEHDLGATRQLLVIDVGVQPDAHLATAGEHVDGAVVVLADDHAVGGRWLGELVDLVAERGDVLACLTQGVAQLLVLRDRLGELALGLERRSSSARWRFGASARRCRNWSISCSSTTTCACNTASVPSESCAMVGTYTRCDATVAHCTV